MREPVVCKRRRFVSQCKVWRSLHGVCQLQLRWGSRRRRRAAAGCPRVPPPTTWSLPAVRSCLFHPRRGGGPSGAAPAGALSATAPDRCSARPSLRRSGGAPSSTRSRPARGPRMRTCTSRGRTSAPRHGHALTLSARCTRCAGHQLLTECQRKRLSRIGCGSLHIHIHKQTAADVAAGLWQRCASCTDVLFCCRACG